ncbi:DUF3017 domain-containing protein [Brachybacterium sillae]|uniref:DUF3017 domain-containing protein n=1 Tax=Brachybacterium sillae TaxID=2810536 RepID=UPI00217CCF5F|nr:DUF3017 domain-containing protein [Brachybacterium sillae]
MRPTRDPRSLGAAVRRQAALLSVLVGVALAVAVALTGRAPAGGLILAAVLVYAAVIRLVAPTARVGALAVRSRVLDVMVMVVLAAGLVVLSGTPNL